MVRACITGVGAGVVLVLALAVAAEPQQAGVAVAAPAGKQLECGAGVLYDPVMPTKATVYGSEAPCLAGLYGTRKLQPPPAFQASGDWLANTDIYFSNRTKKQIVYGEFVVTFPDGPTRNAVPIRLGIMPPVAAFDRSGNPLPQSGREPLSFGPGQTLVIHLGDYITDIASALKPALPADIKKVRINADEFIFDDGMKWSPGAVYLTPDQANPGQWIRMPRGYHPDGYGKGQ